MCLFSFSAGAVNAQQGPLKIRLFWTRPPAELRVHPASEAAVTRRSMGCAPQKFARPLRVGAAGDALEVDGITGEKGPFEISGPHRIEVTGIPPFTLSGPTRIEARGGRLQIITEFGIEEYTARVLAGESSTFASDESLKAMAVAIRTFAQRHRGRHASEGYDLCDTTHCQDLRLAGVTARLRAAAAATEGELLWYEGRLAATYYHRDCGGSTEAAHHVWAGERVAYLVQQQDTACASEAVRRWQAEIRKADLAAALAAEGLRVPAMIQSLEVVRRTPSGRVAELRLIGAGAMPLSAEALRLAVGRRLGWNLLRSDWYEVRDAGAQLEFHGRGAGHGVGLCQAGAARMGEAGRSYREILAHYYPGTKTGFNAQGLAWRSLASERIEVLTTRPREDGALIEAAERVLREAETLADARIAFRPQLRLYPSVEVYRDATGEPGWVAASTRGRVVRLQPPEILLRRGVLEETLRHEMLHVVMESRARRRLPRWFREGLVLALEAMARCGAHACDDFLARNSNRGEFADTSELERALAAPRNRAQLESAYAAARARVGALIEGHGRKQVLYWAANGLATEEVRR